MKNLNILQYSAKLGKRFVFNKWIHFIYIVVDFEAQITNIIIVSSYFKKEFSFLFGIRLDTRNCMLIISWTVNYFIATCYEQQSIYTLLYTISMKKHDGSCFNLV